MPRTAVLKVALREFAARERVPRVLEPDLIMADEQQVAEYEQAGREGGVMAPVYLFHAANICEVIRPGDRVLDLACGPANQLAMVARLNPDVEFVGADLSEPMLERARGLVAEQSLRNVRLQLADISDLSMFEAASFDAVMSTMALHHLPDGAALERTLAEAARVLKPGGGIYLVDFGRLKSEQSIQYFAHQYDGRQPPIFGVDYLNSLRAAFSIDDFRAAARPLANQARVYATFAFPFMVAIKSGRRRAGDSMALMASLEALRQGLPSWHQADFRDLRTFFRLGGLSSHLL